MAVSLKRILAGLSLVVMSVAAVTLSSCGNAEVASEGSASPTPPGTAESTAPSPAGVVWLGSNNDVILRQDSAGSEWERSRLGATSASLNGLNDIAFADGTHGWAAGGKIIHTADAGRTWVAQRSDVTVPLDRVAFADARHGFAVGVDTILATTDGGASWTRQSVDGGLPWNTLIDAVATVDGRNAWAVDERGGLESTTDGGKTWVRTRLVTAAHPLCDLAFVDSRRGWIAAVDMVLSTSDGGLTWSQQSLPGRLFAIAFADDVNGWCVGDVILRTRDGGSSWRDVTPHQYVNDSVVLLDVAVQDAQHIWAVGSVDTGGGNSRGVVLYTSNGGRRWVDATPVVKGGVSAWITVTVAGN